MGVEIKKTQLIFVRNFIKNQRMFVLFSLLDLLMIGAGIGMNFTHLT